MNFFDSLTSTWEAALKDNRPQDVILSGVLAICFFKSRQIRTVKWLR